MKLEEIIKNKLRDNAKASVSTEGVTIERIYDKDTESMVEIANQHVLNVLNWIDENCEVVDNGFKTYKYNGVFYNYEQLLKLHNERE